GNAEAFNRSIASANLRINQNQDARAGDNHAYTQLGRRQQSEAFAAAQDVMSTNLTPKQKYDAIKEMGLAPEVEAGAMAIINEQSNNPIYRGAQGSSGSGAPSAPTGDWSDPPPELMNMSYGGGSSRNGRGNFPKNLV